MMFVSFIGRTTNFSLIHIRIFCDQFCTQRPIACYFVRMGKFNNTRIPRFAFCLLNLLTNVIVLPVPNPKIKMGFFGQK